MRWLGRRKRDLPPEPAEDESDSDRVGQWDFDGRPHAGMRLRRLPFEPIRTTGERGLRSCWSTTAKWCSSIPLQIFTRRPSAKTSRASTLCFTLTPTPTTFSESTTLRPLSYRHKPDKLPLYARPDAAAFLRKMFSYIFDADYKFGGLPLLELKPIDGPVDVFGVAIRTGDSDSWRSADLWLPVRLRRLISPITARFRNRRCTNCEGLDILFLDALRHKPHPTHSTVKNSLAIVDRLKPKRAFFTHICHDLAHEATNATLPRHVRLVA